MLSVGLLASGRLGLLACDQLREQAELKWLMTDRRSTEIIQFCEHHSVPHFVGNPREHQIVEPITSIEIDLLLSVNYLFVAPEKLLKTAGKYAINIHGSLLPRYRGRTPHVWAIINNESLTGVTAHLMEPECDAGDIILQQEIAIEQNHTGGDLLRKFEEVYPVVIDEILEKVAVGSIPRFVQNESHATYFGKRTPEDGRINWDWQRERIRNWIRAQAKPYPGSFFCIHGKTVRVHASEFSNLGFHHEVANGTVLQNDPLTVKCPNGALQLLELEPSGSLVDVGDLLT